MFLLRKIWPALFSWNTGLEIRPSALSGVLINRVRTIFSPYKVLTSSKKQEQKTNKQTLWKRTSDVKTAVHGLLQDQQHTWMQGSMVMHMNSLTRETGFWTWRRFQRHPNSNFSFLTLYWPSYNPYYR